MVFRNKGQIMQTSCIRAGEKAVLPQISDPDFLEWNTSPSADGETLKENTRLTARDTVFYAIYNDESESR